MVTSRSRRDRWLFETTPQDASGDLAAVLAYRAWTVDLRDQIDDATRRHELLAWWRRELDQLAGGDPRHPIFIALQPAVEAGLETTQLARPLDAAAAGDGLRFDTWDEVLTHVRDEAGAYGRMLRQVVEPSASATSLVWAEDLATVIGLVQRMQDIAGDLTAHDVLIIPAAFASGDTFARRLRDSAAIGHGIDREILGESRTAIRQIGERAWAMLESAAAGLDHAGPLLRGANASMALAANTLRLIELWSYETALHRPELNPITTWRIRIESCWLNRRFRFT